MHVMIAIAPKNIRMRMVSKLAVVSLSFFLFFILFNFLRGY